MAAKIALFLLVAIHGGNGSFSMIELAGFESQAECRKALNVIDAAMAERSTVKLGCIPESSFEPLAAAAGIH